MFARNFASVKKVNGVNRLVTKANDKTSKKLSTTDRKKINRLTTRAEIINKCFKKKEHFVFCFLFHQMV